MMESYRELRARLDAKFEEIRREHPKQFACQLGCHSCCKPGLTVNAIEKEEIRIFLREHPEIVARLKDVSKGNPHQGKRCSMLDAQGQCLIYEVRPFVCRSHGAPLQFRPLDAGENQRARDSCPLNFSSLSLAEIPANFVINLDTLNTLLALLCERGFPGDRSRTSLNIRILD